MLKYVDTKVVFQEVPDEISLAISISNCPCHCKNCHSSYLAEDMGEVLDETNLTILLEDNKGITCMCLMGGDNNPSEINKIAKWIKEVTIYKVAWYSGRQELSKDIDLRWFDYIKLGPYIEELGPLNSRTTNQRFYKVSSKELVDITNKFWKHETEN